MPGMFPLPGSSGKSSHKDGNGAAQRDASDLRELVWKLEQRVERQSLLLQALFTLLTRREGGLTERELADEIRSTERQRSEAAPATCAKCHRVIGLRQSQCLYCGERRAPASPFELT